MLNRYTTGGVAIEEPIELIDEGQEYRVLAGQPVKLFRSHRPDVAHGAQSRDFIYIDDVVDVMLWFLDHPEVTGLFNLGTGQARSFHSERAGRSQED